MKLESLERMYWQLLDRAERRNGTQDEKELYSAIYNQIVNLDNCNAYIKRNLLNSFTLGQGFNNAIAVIQGYHHETLSRRDDEALCNDIFYIAVTLLLQCKKYEVRQYQKLLDK